MVSQWISAPHFTWSWARRWTHSPTNGVPPSINVPQMSTPAVHTWGRSVWDWANGSLSVAQKNLRRGNWDQVVNWAPTKSNGTAENHFLIAAWLLYMREGARERCFLLIDLYHYNDYSFRTISQLLKTDVVSSAPPAYQGTVSSKHKPDAYQAQTDQILVKAVGVTNLRRRVRRGGGYWRGSFRSPFRRSANSNDENLMCNSSSTISNIWYIL